MLQTYISRRTQEDNWVIEADLSLKDSWDLKNSDCGKNCGDTHWKSCINIDSSFFLIYQICVKNSLSTCFHWKGCLNLKDYWSTSLKNNRNLKAYLYRKECRQNCRKSCLESCKCLNLKVCRQDCRSHSRQNRLSSNLKNYLCIKNSVSAYW